MEMEFKLDGVTHTLEIGDDLLDYLLRNSTPKGQSNAATVQAGAEIGPVEISGIQIDTNKRDGTAMKDPRYTVTFSNGKKHSTFNGTLGGSAKTLWGMGKKVFYRTSFSKDGKYENLAEIRSAEGKP